MIWMVWFMKINWIKYMNFITWSDLHLWSPPQFQHFHLFWGIWHMELHKMKGMYLEAFVLQGSCHFYRNHKCSRTIYNCHHSSFSMLHFRNTIIGIHFLLDWRNYHRRHIFSIQIWLNSKQCNLHGLFNLHCSLEPRYTYLCNCTNLGSMSLDTVHHNGHHN